MWAIGYCNKLSIKEDLAPAYTVSGITDWESLAYSDIPASSDSAWNAATCNFEANGYRLPTEANFARYSHDGHCDLPVFYSAPPQRRLVGAVEPTCCRSGFFAKNSDKLPELK
ncbi:MAG: hypothetical protein IJP62_13230 [Treponema sp.]|nr:hypothetical protein [Treponema sp.]